MVIVDVLTWHGEHWYASVLLWSGCRWIDFLRVKEFRRPASLNLMEGRNEYRFDYVGPEQLERLLTA